jgi:hypothetical protein
MFVTPKLRSLLEFEYQTKKEGFLMILTKKLSFFEKKNVFQKAFFFSILPLS